MQGLFHAEWVARLVQGLATVEEFEQETQNFSKLLVDKGKELGAICMGDQSPEEKDSIYFPAFFAVQRELYARFEKLKKLNEAAGVNGEGVATTNGVS